MTNDVQNLLRFTITISYAPFLGVVVYYVGVVVYYVGVVVYYVH